MSDVVSLAEFRLRERRLPAVVPDLPEATDPTRLDQMMGAVYFAWDAATGEEATLALRWAHLLLAQSRYLPADPEATTYVLGGQYLQSLQRRRRGDSTTGV